MHIDVFQYCSDHYTFIPFLKAYRKQYGYLPKYPVADAGYGSFRNYKFCSENKLELYQKYTMYAKDKDLKYLANPFLSKNYQKDNNGNYICPNGRKMNYLYTSKRKEGEYEKVAEVYECETCKRCQLKKIV